MGQNATVEVGDVFFCGQWPLCVTEVKGRKIRVRSLTEGVHLKRAKPVVHVEITDGGVKKALTLPLSEE